MNANTMHLGQGDIEPLILRALVRKLIAKNVLSPDDLKSLLLDAARHSDLVVGNNLTEQEALHIVEGDLLPTFLSP
ncbi:hypothetical protein [Dyella silvae]|uniref:hypothetical protein n=1 Tax=Dyella silvae TaxID=2994424 RepID=UPI00226545CC|nr:hypothetical protein [Dyella silvae]